MWRLEQDGNQQDALWAGSGQKIVKVVDEGEIMYYSTYYE